MDTLYFLLSLIAIAWLALWSARGANTTDRLWWPFDMKSPVGDAAGDGTAPGCTDSGGLKGWRERVTHPDPAARPETAATRSRAKRRGAQHGG